LVANLGPSKPFMFVIPRRFYPCGPESFTEVA